MSSPALLPTIKIRFYGESFTIYSLTIDATYSDQFYETAVKMQQPIEEAILDVRFFKLLGIAAYQSIYDLQSDVFGGLMYNAKNKIEIRRGRKCLQKFTMKNLLIQETLFPLFTVQQNTFQVAEDATLFLIEKEVGMTAEYTIDNQDFMMESLKFIISDAQYATIKHQLLTGLCYNEEVLHPIKSDSLLSYQHCILSNGPPKNDNYQ